MPRHENGKIRHLKFTPEEDEELVRLVSIYGTSSWVKIASFIKGRNNRQCRERWTNYLSPGINKANWTHDEDNLLLQKVNEIGKQWVKISEFFPGRTDQMMKNRYHKLTHKKVLKRKKVVKKVKPLKQAFLIMDLDKIKKAKSGFYSHESDDNIFKSEIFDENLDYNDEELIFSDDQNLNFNDISDVMWEI